MKQSTATFIAYDLRPSKQAERRIMLDFLKCANEAGLAIADCRYVGMGGMISLERDPKLHPRCSFNCPFDFIKVRNKTAAHGALLRRTVKKVTSGTTHNLAFATWGKSRCGTFENKQVKQVLNGAALWTPRVIQSD